MPVTAQDMTHNQRLLATLAALYMEGSGLLSHYPWHWEEERWHELLVCALICAGATPESSRAAIQLLSELKLADSEILAKPDLSADAVVSRIFSVSGISEKSAQKAKKLLQQTSAVCLANWSGQPQRFLRKMAHQWAKNLAEQFVAGGMEHNSATALSILWLQNVTSAPILATGSAVTAFCGKTGSTEEDLVQAADSVGLNVALVEELLQMWHNHDMSIEETPDSGTADSKKQPSS